jgi:hypothetical protein
MHSFSSCGLNVSFTVPAGETWSVHWTTTVAGTFEGWAVSHSPDPGRIACGDPSVLCFPATIASLPGTYGTQAMARAGAGRFWMWLGKPTGHERWSVQILATGTPAPEPGLPALHQAVRVSGVPDQPAVSYTVVLDQAWPGLQWSSGSLAKSGGFPVQFRFTMTTRGAVPLRDETPARDPTLVLTRPDGQRWAAKAVAMAATFECPKALPAAITLLNPGRSLTGCVVFNVPGLYMFALQSPSTRLVWQPEGALNQDQESYSWQPWPTS